MSDFVRPRLFLIAPDNVSADANAERVADALTGGDVACVLFGNIHTKTRPGYRRYLEAGVPVCRDREVAALVHNDAALVEITGADGLHADDPNLTCAQMVERLHPKSIVGCGGVHSRHAAMEAGEAGVDYLFFGQLSGTGGGKDDPLELAEWWAGIFQTPCVGLANRTGPGLEAVMKTKCEFIALQDWIWADEDGPSAAVARANALIDARAEAQG